MYRYNKHKPHMQTGAPLRRAYCVYAPLLHTMLGTQPAISHQPPCVLTAYRRRPSTADTVYDMLTFILLCDVAERLPACMSTHHTCAMPVEAKRGLQSSWNPGPLGKQPVPLTGEPSL